MEKNKLKVLGIIGARSGSKGVKDKNIKNLNGKPLMAWIIDAAKNSKYINRLIISTDSENYATIAKQYGVEVPFLRPPSLSTDLSPEIDYITYTINRLEKEEFYVPDIVVRLFPTVPLQLSEDIDKCIESLLSDKKAHSSVVIAESRQHPMKALKLIEKNEESYLVSYNTENGKDVTPIARQNYPKSFVRANVIVSKTSTIKTMNSLTGDFVKYHVIPQERAIDIDSPIDFFIAEKLIEYFKEHKKTTTI